MRAYAKRNASIWLAYSLAANLLAALPAYAAEEQRVGDETRTGLDITVYNQDLGLISERRKVTLRQGMNILALEGVSAALRPETVLLRGADLRLVEQSFTFDLITPRRLLEASVGQDVRVVRVHPQTGEETVVEARVLGIAEGPVLRIGDRIETGVPGRVVFDRLPDGVRERPTLLASVDSTAGGEAEIELSYLSGGLSWRADYVAELNEAADRLDLTGLVTLRNTSGTSFREATLRLIAGDVNTAPMPRMRQEMKAMAMMESAADMSAPAPQAASDRYLYLIDRLVTLADRETKQIVLLTAQSVAVRKTYRFDSLVNAQRGADEIGPLNATVTLEMDNKTDDGLGQPLPAGTVRVYEAAPGGNIFAGEDAIRHTAEGERIKLALGTAFDVTGEAKRTVFERISNRSYETGQKIILRNAKDDPVDVQIIGTMPPGWRLLRESAAHTAVTANKIVWTVRVPGNGAADLSYRIRVNS